MKSRWISSRYHRRIRWSFFFRVTLTTNILHLPPPPFPFSYFPPLSLLLTLSSHSPHKRAFSLDVRGEGARDVCVGGYLFPFFSDPDCCHSVYFCLSACTGLWEGNWDIPNRTLLSHYHYQRRPRLYLGLSLPWQFWRGGPGSKVSECSSIEFICFRFVVVNEPKWHLSKLFLVFFFVFTDAESPFFWAKNVSIDLKNNGWLIALTTCARGGSATWTLCKPVKLPRRSWIARHSSMQWILNWMI